MAEPPVTSIKDFRLKPFRRPQDDRTSFMVEGAAMLRQGLDAGWIPLAVLFLDPVAEKWQALYQTSSQVAPTFRALRGVFFKTLGLGYETSTEAIALFGIPDILEAPTVAGRKPGRTGTLYLVGEAIRDPRNVGVLVRTADAFGVDTLVFTRDSAWPWSRQAVRSSTGSVFRVRVNLGGDTASLLHALREEGVQILGSSAGAAADVDQAPIRYPCAVVLGSESAGLGDTTRAQCDTVVKIPMAGGAHSLNVTVAAGILLHTVRRRARLEQVPPPQQP